MTSFTDKLSRFSNQLRLMLILLVAISINFGLYLHAQWQQQNADQLRTRTHELAEELRQSSDDLTSLARTYVVTGDAQMRARYQRILDIRDGIAPRPESYTHRSALWVPLAELETPPQSSTVGLLDLIRNAGFSDDECVYLGTAKHNSDLLTRTELAAMDMIAPGTSAHSAARSEAIGMLYEPAYLEAKAKIMRAIDQVGELTRWRTAAAAEAAHRRALVLLALLAVLGAVQLTLLWRSRNSFLSVFGAPLRVLQRHFAQLGSGQVTVPIAVPAGHHDSVLGWLAETQQRLASIDGERAAAEAQTRAAAQRFRDMVNATDGIVWEADAATFQFTFISEKAERLLGFPVDEWLVPGFWVKHLHPDDKTWAPDYCASCTGRLEAHDFEYRFIARDGRTVWLRDIVSVVSENGEPRWLRGIMVDITGSKRAEQRYRRVIESAMDGFCVLASDARVLECNAALSELSGYARAELLGLHLPDLDMAAGDVTRTRMECVMSQGRERFESQWRRKNGTLMDVEVTLAYLSMANEYCVFVRDISLPKAHEQELYRIAHYDSLTGVANRSLLADRMAQAIAQTQRSGHLMAVCYLDLDGFKPINDQYGHEVGDQLLVHVAERLREALRGGDTVARIGGDEFVLLLMGLEHADECEAAATRLLGAVSRAFSVNALSLNISASLGVALYPRDDADADTLLRHADQAMYVAKQSGKNRFHLFDPEHDRRARARTEALARLRLALQRDEFVLYYQPQVSVPSGTVYGVEALIRWQHPERGLLPPGDFLPAIEESDLIVDLGDWVIDRALTQLLIWQAGGLTLSVSVNIAARHLLRADFVPRLKAHLERHPGVRPGALDIEVLETAALEDIEHVSQVIHECHALGVVFSLDDFGTGYSSLKYLKALPAETLKIDQTFVRDMLTDREDRSIVEGVIGLARIFGRHVIAEGVESAEHGVALYSLGCEKAQGYGIARPMPAPDLPAWIAQWRAPAQWK